MALVVLLAGGFYLYRNGGAQSSFSRRNDLLARMPADAAAVLFIDLAELRATPFLAPLYAWAKTPQADPHYAQFQKDTGFDFARDLTRLAVAWKKTEQPDPVLLALAEGNFDQARISAFARKTGTVRNSGKHELFSVPLGGSAKSFSFTFLRADRVALTNGWALASFLDTPKRDPEIAAWRVRFERLSRSPIFAVIRKDAGAGDALARQAPGGLRSPELSSLLDQLEWISIAGKLENDGLRVTAEGEASGDTTTRELADLLRGMLVLAEAGWPVELSLVQRFNWERLRPPRFPRLRGDWQIPQNRMPGLAPGATPARPSQPPVAAAPRGGRS